MLFKRCLSLVFISINIVIFIGYSNIDRNKASEELINQKVADLISKMTLDEKIGQIAQVDRKFLKSEEDIKTYFFGSLLSGGSSTPPENNPVAWADMVDRYQSYAMQTRLGIPLIYGIDAVHGHNSVVGAVVFPHNIGLGCTNNPDLVEKASYITAKEVKATGIHWTFSPCVAMPQDDRWGRQYEGYSESSDIVKSLGKASVLGYQGKQLGKNKNSILSCAKHFVGDGGAKWGTGLENKIDHGDLQIDEEKLRNSHLQGYISAIDAGVGSIMISYSSVNGIKMHAHKELITDLLKEELGFDGIVVSDWMGIAEIPGDDKSDIEISINAGIDMIMIPEHYEVFLSTLKELVRNNKISMERINDAVSRILKIKYKMGLFDNPFSNRSNIKDIGSTLHRNIAKECVRQSVVLLKNNNDILPISKEIKNLYVVGQGANDIGIQCGGWTISWQGEIGPITRGTTIFDGILKTVIDKTQVTYSKSGDGISDADLIVLVVSELPYAEMNGDRAIPTIEKHDKVAINNVKNSNIPTVTIILSGRPLIIENEINDWDGLIAAWLPGTEGEGISDVLFGEFKPTGKLSYSWPRSATDIPINIGDIDYDPLYPLGFGLTY